MDIHEHGHRPLMEDGERPREKGIGRDQNFIAGTDAGGPQRHVQGVGAGADGTTIGNVHAPRPLLLQCGNLGRVATAELLFSQDPAQLIEFRLTVARPTGSFDPLRHGGITAQNGQFLFHGGREVVGATGIEPMTSTVSR